MEFYGIFGVSSTRTCGNELLWEWAVRTKLPLKYVELLKHKYTHAAAIYEHNSHTKRSNFANIREGIADTRGTIAIPYP